MRLRTILPIFAVMLLANIVRAEDPTQRHLPLEVTGPVTVSPFFLAAQPKANAHRDHYMYSMPAWYYIGGGGGWYGGWNGPYIWYPAPFRGAFYNDYSYFRR